MPQFIPLDLFELAAEITSNNRNSRRALRMRWIAKSMPVDRKESAWDVYSHVVEIKR